MKLTPEQQAMLDGAQGETMAKVVRTLVMYGDAFGAERMVPITGKCGHTVISFGLKAIQPVYELYDQLIAAGLTAGQKFTADPRPIDPAVPTSLLEDIVFKKIMYTRQKEYEAQLKKLGITKDEDYTCTCYLDQVGNKPEKGDVLSWAESSAVVFANSVLGARCNRNSGIIELMGSVAGFVPEFGLLTDEGRKADWIVEVNCAEKPEAQLLGSAIGMKVMEAVPYVRGLDKWLGTELNEDAVSYLKDFGAAAASNGAVGLYHIENLTPEAKEQGETLIREGAQVYVIDDAELRRVKESYPVVWKNPDADPVLCFVGCPHLTLKQMEAWCTAIGEKLRQSGRDTITVPTVFTASPAVIREAEKGTVAARLRSYGVVISYICPLMYMNNPLCKKKPVITCSNKLRTYTSARFYTEAEILDMITGKEGSV
ncbi:MAG: aconitase X catalytic domain-containing protein [Oscillospiraceae bacterium]|nr:aconitase X catalytic domain-containing protein [Oscillospiraceae bacterium]